MNYAIILAGGVGQRMRTSGLPKQFLTVFGKPIIIYTLEKFENCSEIDKIVISCNASWVDYMRDLVNKYNLKKILDIIPGGKDRQGSVQNGIDCIVSNGASNDDIIVIHDGVRPLITEETITDNISKVKECGSCITCVPAIETVIIDNHNGSLGIPKRSDCMMARAPQSFYLKDIIGAHRKSQEDGKTDFIDSCSLMSYYGYKLGLVQGPMENIKITTPTDYFVLRAMVIVHENQQIFGY